MNTQTPRTCACGIRFLVEDPAPSGAAVGPEGKPTERQCFFCRADPMELLSWQRAQRSKDYNRKYNDKRRRKTNARDHEGRAIKPDATARTVKRRDYQRRWKAKKIVKTAEPDQ
jgi:hypothetical protein